MRQIQKKAKKRTRTKPREPLAEGTIPLNSHGHRDWISMSDDEIVAFTMRFMEEKGIRGRGELCKADSGLYRALRVRKLLDRIGFEDKLRNWSSFSDEQLVEYARKFMEERGISRRTELRKADSGLCYVLQKRKLMDKVGFEEKLRKWRSLSDTQLIEHTRKFMEEKGISGRKELEKADSGLYCVLQRRKLLDRVGFEERMRKKRDWRSLSDTQLIEHTRQFMEKRGISKRWELGKADRGLYYVLQKRKLMDKVGFEEKLRKWRSLSDTQLIEHTRKFMEEKGISGRKELYKADGGLYQTLQKRKLLDKIGFKEIRRNWRLLSDAQVVEHARKFMEEEEISGRKELYKADGGLYVTLRLRKLLDRAFADVEQAKEREEAQALFDGLAEFGGAG